MRCRGDLILDRVQDIRFPLSPLSKTSFLLSSPSSPLSVSSPLIVRPSIHPKRARSTLKALFSRPRLADCCAILSFRSPYALATAISLGCRGRSSVAAFDQQSPDDTGHLVGQSHVISIFGLRVSICASHDPVGAPRRQTCRTTALAPSISKRRIVRSPRFDGAEFLLTAGRLLQWRQPEPGVKSRPFGASRAGTSAVTAVAVIVLMPEIVISRRATGSAFERR